VLKQILTESGKFRSGICEAPNGSSLLTLSPFDLVIVDTALATGSDTEKAVAAFVAAGKGLVVTHTALYSSQVPSYSPLGAAGGSEQPVGFLDVKLARSSHPILRGMPGGFRTPDSLPQGVFARREADVIATLELSGRAVPVLAVSPYGKGRVVAVALGHDASAMHEPQLRAIMARASEWAASGAVTVPPAREPALPSDRPLKGLLITGGHDHDAAFYSLFSGYSEIERLPVDTAASAYKNDLRGRYDVIIMYDFTRDLDETGKKNLVDFLQSGKGVVVLHHALLNFQSWNWWSEEVVGGRYRLRKEGASSASTVKDNQQIYANPARSHAVLARINPFHITDEAYKNLFMSPRIRPLLVTDNPTSDTNLAWIGPSDRYRVVAIQLGHGRSAFEHPAYRTLVRNAVMWAAGRTD
jgi:type 1 glutamine amidotransferase